MKTIVNTERKDLSSEYTLVWYWFDRSEELPGWRQGIDDNFPSTGLYLNGKLISTVHWNKGSVTLEMVQSFLNSASDFQKLPGFTYVPETL